MDISIALGGGGSRGYAHIGVIRKLKEEGYRIKAAAGTSAGGIIALAYAAGYSPNEMEAIFSKVDQSKLFSRSPDEGPGILGLAGATKFFQDFFGDRTFSDLLLPCAVVAVELKTGREFILNQGKLVDAVLATVAVPGVFPPRHYGNVNLVDGAVMNPVPVSVARALKPRLPVVAVILGGLQESPVRLNALPLPVPVPVKLVERLTRIRVAQAFNIFLQSVDIGSRKLAELRLLVDRPEVIIRPDVQGIGLLDKVDIHQIIQQGELATKAVLPDLRRSVLWPSRIWRKISN